MNTITFGSAAAISILNALGFVLISHISRDSGGYHYHDMLVVYPGFPLLVNIRFVMQGSHWTMYMYVVIERKEALDIPLTLKVFKFNNTHILSKEIELRIFKIDFSMLKNEFLLGDFEDAMCVLVESLELLSPEEFDHIKPKHRVSFPELDLGILGPSCYGIMLSSEDPLLDSEPQMTDEEYWSAFGPKGARELRKFVSRPYGFGNFPADPKDSASPKVTQQRQVRLKVGDHIFPRYDRSGNPLPPGRQQWNSFDFTHGRDGYVLCMAQRASSGDDCRWQICLRTEIGQIPVYVEESHWTSWRSPVALKVTRRDGYIIYAIPIYSDDWEGVLRSGYRNGTMVCIDRGITKIITVH